MKKNWFKRTGMIYYPVSVPGTMILIAAVCVSIYLFIDIDSRSHSASDTLINFFFFLLIIAAVYTFIGFLTGRKK